MYIVMMLFYVLITRVLKQYHDSMQNNIMIMYIWDRIVTLMSGLIRWKRQSEW